VCIERDYEYQTRKLARGFLETSLSVGNTRLGAADCDASLHIRLQESAQTTNKKESELLFKSPRSMLPF
jgi:hypothetical protein